MNIPLKTIIANFISSADLSEHQFMRLWNIGVMGARSFNLDISGRFKTVLLDVAANKTADLPTDYLTLSKLGVLNANGEVIPFRQNTALNALHAEYTDQLDNRNTYPAIDPINALTSPTRFPFIWLNFTVSGSEGYHLFGLGSGTGTVGEYKIDEECRTIFLSSDWPYSQIVLEYLSDGYDSECDDFVIDVKAEEAMMSYIRWKNAQDNRKKYSTGDVQYYKREFYNQKRLAKMRLNPVNISDMQAVFRSNIKLVAKA